MNLEQFYTVAATVVIVTTTFSIALTIYTWRRRHIADVRYFIWFLVASTGWQLTASLSFISPTPEVAAFLLGKVKFVCVATVPVTFLILALNYTGYTRWSRPQNLVLLTLIPAVTQIMAWTNSPLFITDRVFQRYGPYLIEVSQNLHPWFWVHTVYSYSLVAIGLILFFLFAIRSRYPYRAQAMIMLWGGLFVLLTNILTVFNLITPEPVEFTALTFGVANLVWAWALFRYRLLDIMPVARDAVIESMADAVIVLDVQNRIVDLNPAARALILTNPASIIGRSLGEIWPDQRELIESYTGVSETHTEIAVDIGADRRVFDLNISTLYQNEDKAAGRLVVLRDITARIQAKAEREQLIADLEAYAHTVAHDLKNPLNLMAGYADLLATGVVSEEAERETAIQAIQDGTLKMTNIIGELLLLASVRKQENVDLRPLKMTRIIEEAQKRLVYLIKESQAEFTVPNTLPLALGYAPWIEEVWTNYISNALKYGGQPPRIEIGATAQSNGLVQFWVKDNGKGLTPEEQTRLFAQFARIDQTHGEGHGLGLSIVKRIVEKLGGEVGVESEADAGSTFWFTLPSPN